MSRINSKWSQLVAPLLLSVLLGSCDSSPKKLPFYGIREPIEKIVDGKTITDTLYAAIPSFSFLNQDSTLIDGHFFDDKIYVADFFFTTCPTICPTMHRNLLSIYEKFKGNDQVAFLSHTIDYRYDLPSVLKAYATKLGIKDKRWQFVHGSRDAVYGLAEKNYLVAVGEDEADKSNYIHQGFLVLVDKNKHVRGSYDGTDSKQVEQMGKDMELLLLEK